MDTTATPRTSNVRISPTTHERARVYAFNHRRSISTVVDDAVNAYLDAQESAQKPAADDADH